MNTVVLKFGGTSVADNIKLNVVADQVIRFKQEAKNVVVVVSAQGKKTNQLIKEAQELSAIPEEREMDVLLSTGEQITASKLSILLNRKGYPSISLTGWQAGIKTNAIYTKAKIEQIYTNRLEKELEKGKIVVVAGFQGLNEEEDITTLGRGGSDTTAVALQVALKADKCYIFSDVDGIYSADPNMITVAKRLDEISFDEMQEVADAGAKVLHNRCIQIGKKFDCHILSKSTFSNQGGTRICQQIETAKVKSIIKNEQLETIKMEKRSPISEEEFYTIYEDLLQNNIIVEAFQKKENNVQFRIQKAEQNKVQELLDSHYLDYRIQQEDMVKLSIVGYGIIQDNQILKQVMNILKKHQIKILDIYLTQAKIEIIVKEIENAIITQLHEKLI